MQSVEINPRNVDGTIGVSKSQINGQDLKKYFQAGLTWLKTNQQIVNSLNVFPVPDGDTGTNMFLTLKTAYAEIEGENSTNAGGIAKKFAHGALMGSHSGLFKHTRPI